MEIVLQTNVFFFITSVATIVIAVMIGVAIYYVIGILKNVRDVTDRVRRGSENLAEDLEELRDNLKEEGARVKHVVDFFGRRSGWFPGEGERPKRRSRRKVRSESSEEK